MPSTFPSLLLALDYGGTKHTAALLVPGERMWLAHGRVFSPPGADATYDQAAMLGLARGLLAQHPGRLAAIGVSFGGPVDATRGLVRLSHHVPGWEETPLAERLQAELAAPVSVDNDANVAALGEWTFGAGQGCASLLYVTVSNRHRWRLGIGWPHLERRRWHGRRDRPQCRAPRRRAVRLRQGRLSGGGGVRVGDCGEGAGTVSGRRRATGGR